MSPQAAEFDVVGVGLNATDTMLVVPHFPAYGGKAPFSREFYSVGGQVATAIVACARLGLQWLKPLKEALPAEISFEEIRLVVADLRTRKG